MRLKEGYSKVQEELEFDPYRGYHSCGGPFSTETSTSDWPTNGERSHMYYISTENQ